MVPNGWEVKILEDLASVERGKFSARPRNDPKYYGGEIPFVQTGDIAGAKTYLKSYSQTLNEEGLKVSRLFPKNTILITIAANIGDVAITSFDVACPDSLVAIQPKENADVVWLYFYLETCQKELDGQATQNAQKNINLQVLRPLKILTPPLPEQQKIAKILSTWDKAISTTERLIDNSTQQKKALMQQLLTGKKRLLDESGKRFEGEWEQVSLEHHMESFTNGYAFSASQYKLEGIPIITMGNIGLDGKFNERTHKQNFWQSDSSLDKFLVNKDDLLIAMTDVTPDKNLIGRMTIVTAEKSFYLNQRVGLIRLKPSLDRHFLRCLSNSTDWRKYSVAVSASGVQANMSTKDIKKGKIKLPTIFEQRKIATVLTNADKEIELLEQQLADLQQEKKALMQVLLTGKKRVVVDGES
ncbi:restriction endonuclease subunit S [Psychrobacter sp. CCUG 69069]|uniref:restriction endonuclease subunit S n=1 Tax=Psychrobacter sp. CCUG 69069 TaxID=2282777 RepID=UPI001E56D056|nr:restriction endonuclease subunit S [Psychrobacter sp. CCUG 69069]MCD1279831.1 restriction endonuclease subunit S [Psychrobacter sp. CCUG 69069]